MTYLFNNNVNVANEVEIKNDTGNPVLVSLGSESITITGNVNVGSSVSVNNTTSSPVVSTITSVGTSGILATPYLPVNGTVTISGTPTVNIGTIPEVEIKNDTGSPIPVSGTVSVSGTTTVSGTVAISGTPTVNIGTIPEVEIKNDTGSPIPVSGTVSIGGTPTISGTVSISGTPTVNIGTIPEVEIKNDTGNPVPVSINGSTLVNGRVPVDLYKYASIVDEINFAQNTTLQAYTQFLFRDDEFIDTATGGGGTATWSSATGGVSMTVSSPGDYVIRQTRLSHQYLASAPHLYDMTTVDITPVAGVVKEYGYYSTSTSAPYTATKDGFLLETDDTQLWLRIYKQGAVIFEKAQSGWDDPMDGTGASGVTLTKSAFQAIGCEFLYLGGTEARFFFLIGGKGVVVAHTFKNSNVNAATFIGSPNQPLRWCIRRNGGSGAATMLQICGKVGSKGLNSQKLKLRPHRYNVGGVYTFQPNTIGTEYVISGIKLSTRYGVVAVSKFKITSTSTDDFVVRLRRNATLSSALTYTPIAYTAYSVAYAPTPAAPTITASGGTIVYDENYSSVSNQEFEINIDNMMMQLGQSINGTFDEFVFTVEPITAGLNLRTTLWIQSLN